MSSWSPPTDWLDEPIAPPKPVDPKDEAVKLLAGCVGDKAAALCVERAVAWHTTFAAVASQAAAARRAELKAPPASAAGAAAAAGAAGAEVDAECEAHGVARAAAARADACAAPDGPNGEHSYYVSVDAADAQKWRLESRRNKGKNVVQIAFDECARDIGRRENNPAGYDDKIVPYPDQTVLWVLCSVLLMRVRDPNAPTAPAFPYRVFNVNTGALERPPSAEAVCPLASAAWESRMVVRALLDLPHWYGRLDGGRAEGALICLCRHRQPGLSLIRDTCLRSDAHGLNAGAFGVLPAPLFDRVEAFKDGHQPRTATVDVVELLCHPDIARADRSGLDPTLPGGTRRVPAIEYVRGADAFVPTDDEVRLLWARIVAAVTDAHNRITAYPQGVATALTAALPDAPVAVRDLIAGYVLPAAPATTAAK